MKKLTLTIAILISMAAGAVAQPLGGGLFQRGETSDSHGDRSSSKPLLPTQHGFTDDQNADGPLGSGIAVLVALGGAYLVGRRRKAE
ncbi:MAG: hypothetical protein IJQ11_13480 [Bacteroidales bacterium]|nr:hypothetical protein [Bacteroidales bacterium]